MIIPISSGDVTAEAAVNPAISPLEIFSFFPGADIDRGHIGPQVGPQIGIGGVAAVGGDIWGDIVGIGANYPYGAVGIYASSASVAVSPGGFVDGEMIVDDVGHIG